MKNINSNKFTIIFNKIKYGKEFDSFELVKEYINKIEEIFTSLIVEVWCGTILYVIYDSETGWQEIKGYTNDS